MPDSGLDQRSGITGYQGAPISAYRRHLLTGTDIFWNIAIPFRTSDRATSCGVDTMTAPVKSEDEY